MPKSRRSRKPYIPTHTKRVTHVQICGYPIETRNTLCLLQPNHQGNAHITIATDQETGEVFLGVSVLSSEKENENENEKEKSIVEWQPITYTDHDRNH